MTRAEAAAILGIQPSAGQPEIQRAFRRAARDTHPDSGPPGNAERLKEVQEARDVMLRGITGGPAGPKPTRPKPWPPNRPTWPPPKTAPSDRFPSASTRKGDDGGSRNHEGADTGSSVSNWVVTITIVTVLVVFAVVGAILIVAAMFGGEPQSSDAPAPVTADCVRIEGDSPEAVPCDEAGAQRIVARHQGVADCSAGQGLLFTGVATWCLEPVGS